METKNSTKVTRQLNGSTLPPKIQKIPKSPKK